MSFFAVTYETIGSIQKHPNADRLDIARLADIDFQFVVGKDTYKCGDTVIYFPLDSILPPDLLQHLGLTGKLGGKEKNRVKTIKLRGEISQGVVATLEDIKTYLEARQVDITKADLTKDLEVTKYEPPEHSFSVGKGPQHHRVSTLPEGLSVYDIEGCERNANAVVELALGLVNIQEKLEGSNWSGKFSYDFNGIVSFQINTRRHEIILKENEHDVFVDTATNQDLWKLAKYVYDQEKLQGNDFVALYGELCGPGIQKNIYKKTEHTIYIFDIKVNDRWLDVDTVIKYCNQKNVLHVPVLAHNVDLVEWVAAQLPADWDESKQGDFTIARASDGKSLLHPEQLREGIVIRPMVGQFCKQLYGRLILKQRSPAYLAKE